ncbi:hypothetical protein WJX84_008502 [Apatococcus fuscideae]|uniref:Uncharacterized protein n=1 Tax=Apatococcus fuscideae TaxID=2026836 RepID=A0AAW1TD65_9CHLO
MDASAAQQQSQGLPSMSIQWGAWASVATLAYDYPTVQALAEFITPQLGPATSHAPATFAVALKSQGSLGLMHTDHSATSVVVRAVASQFPQAESGGIKNGEAPQNVAGGVNVMLSPKTAVKICRLQALSTVGRCKTFDVSADGYGRGEGVGLMFLAASAGGEQMLPTLAVLQGSAINQDGRSSSLTAPNGISQQALISTTLQAAGLAPAAICCLAVHGTGTPLGDPIETGAIGRALSSKVRGGQDQLQQQLALTSVKSCYGHTEGAAGVAGAQMAIATLQAGAQAPILNLRSVNSYVAGSWEEWAGQMRLHNSASRQSGPAPLSLGNMSAADGIATFACRLNEASLSYLHDHRVQGRSLMPGTGFFELAQAAAQAVTETGSGQLMLAGIAILAPCVLPDPGTPGGPAGQAQAQASKTDADTAQGDLLYEAQLLANDVWPSPGQASSLAPGSSQRAAYRAGLSITTSNGQQRISLHASEMRLPVEHPTASNQHGALGRPKQPPLELFQTIARDGKLASGVTAILQGGLPTGGQLSRHDPSTPQEALRGLMRVAAIELSTANWDVMDVVANAPTSKAQVSGEGQGCLGHTMQEGYGMEARLLRAPANYPPTEICLVPEPRGAFSNLRPRALPEAQLGPEQIELHPLAVGLNFRDVLNCLGMYPGDPGNPGADCAGIVTAVGCAVQDLHKVGDYVFGQAEGCLGTLVVTSAHTMVPCPQLLSPVEASTIPTVFMTAWSCLREAACLVPSQHILIHAATGGLGLAAIQPAPAMVLNSLTSPGMVAASVASLALGGQFVEVGKRDIWSPARIAQERSDIRSHLVAIDFWPPKTVGSHMRQLAVLFRQGKLKPLPPLTHPLSSAAAGLRQLSAARHVGKIVVQNPASSNAGGLAPMSRKGRWVVTGGLGALGSLSGRWLARRGIHHICLLGRTGHMPAQQGVPGLAVNSGAWAGAGMAAAAGIERMARLGFGAIQPNTGMAALGSLLRSLQGSCPAAPQVMGSAFFWDRLKVKAPFYQEFKEGLAAGLEQDLQAAPISSSLTARKQRAMTSAELESQIAQAVASVIGSSVDPSQPLVAAGLDSLGAVELRNEIGRAVGSELPGTLVYDYPTLSSIVAYLLPKLAPAAADPIAGLAIPQSRTLPLATIEQSGSATMISVEAITSRMAVNPEVAAHAGDAMKVVPLDRWDVDDQSGHQLGRFGGFIAGWAEFDPALFGIAPTEAALMDPSQRLLLEDTWDILESDSGLQQTAVAVGIARLSDPPAVTSHKGGGGFTGTGRALSVAAGRLSYAHGLKGPSVSMDTACSSSLTGGPPPSQPPMDHPSSR